MSDIASPIARAGASPQGSAPDAAATRDAQRQEVMRVAQQFEGMLLTQMLREMRKASEWTRDGDEGAAGMSLGTESFTEAIDTELGMHLARHQGIGLTTQLINAFERLADVETEPSNTAQPGQTGVGPFQTSGVQPKVTSEFGWRADPFTGQARFHKGIDLRAAYGQDVQSAASGTVVFSGEQRGYGTTVVIEHADGSRARYAHLSATAVEAGTEVAAGQSLGRAGRTGRATGTHLHFEVTAPDGSQVSPAEWLQGRPAVTRA